MTNTQLKTSLPANLFLGKLSLPVDRAMASVALTFASEIADQLALDKSLRQSLGLATEEAFLNAVEHFSGSISAEETIQVEFSLQHGELVISIRERGIPFRFDEAKRYSTDSLEDMERPGLGSLLMANAMDHVEYFVHGREGKETRLRKQLPPDTSPPYTISTRKKRHRKRRTLDNIIVRKPTNDELAAVSQLAWRCYGYSQESFLYDHDILREKIHSGLFRSLIAIDENSGQVVGHSGFKYNEPDSPVPEVGTVFLDPTFRLPGVSAQLSDALYNLAMETKAQGVFDSSVTTHTFSQKMSQATGNIPCCILFGIAAEGMKVRELATTYQPKGSVINHYHALDVSPRTIYAPSRHWDLMRDIYQDMKLPREFATSNPILPDESACTLIHLPEELRAAFIIVHSIGKTTFVEIAEHLRSCRMERLDGVYTFLPLSDQGTPQLVEQCEKIGFSFAGLMPHIHNGDDRLLLQHVDVPIEMDKIRIYGDQARELFRYIRTEKERVEKC